ncbi:MAG: glycogen debranching protein GlgX [Eubacterium sp.]|nr:glycogen debranching protein GlgX [Eubacterium sp.]
MIRADSFPTHKIGDLECRAGRVFPFGAKVVDGGVNFSVYSKEATSCTLVLYHHGEPEPFVEIDIPNEYKVGNVYAIMIFGINIETTEYGYRFDGVYDPRHGLWFDRTKVLLDPYAKSVSGRSVWGKKPETDDKFRHRGQIIMEDYDWESDTQLGLEQKDLCIYEMHVRSFTMGDERVRHKGTFYGIIEKIPYLKKLGINCIELMPIFEFDEFENSRQYNGSTLYNYWGYSTVNFFAPKAGYASSSPLGMEADELKNLIKKLHKNGIEIILDVVFNHTAEGNENGPYISYRGIDNRTYYMLTPEGYYYNFSGCGNTFNGNNAVVRTMIMDCLRYWVYAYHVDGFRFDLASILTRDANGTPMYTPPLIEQIANDPILGRTKLIAEAWDAGGLYQVGSFPSWNRIAEWNGKYRDCVRRFIKGDAESSKELYWRIGGSKDMYELRSSDASINFITCHDGFTMYDMVSYNEKHNEANGEDNLDGSNDNNSWNCGAEGETDDREINDLRMRQIKNAFAILLTSRGVPMFLAGDEFANTQYGNNNAYCQDNGVSWLDWSRLRKNKELFDYVKSLIAFRGAHPVLRNNSFDEGHNGTGYPELSFHGEAPWEYDPMEPTLVFGYMFAEDHEKYGTDKDRFIYVGLNSHWESHSLGLPIIPGNMKWYMVADSGCGVAHGEGKLSEFAGERVQLQPRSSVILLAE